MGLLWLHFPFRRLLLQQVGEFDGGRGHPKFPTSHTSCRNFRAAGRNQATAPMLEDDIHGRSPQGFPGMPAEYKIVPIDVMVDKLDRAKVILAQTPEGDPKSGPVFRMHGN